MEHTDQSSVTPQAPLGGMLQPVMSGQALPVQALHDGSSSVGNQTFGQPMGTSSGDMYTQQQGSALDRAVALAINIVARTRDNPHQQAQQLNALKASYLEEQYGVKPQS